jgi:hypothetical protein
VVYFVKKIMIPHRGNPAISFQVYFKNGIHKLTIAARRPCPEEVPVGRAQVSSQQNKIALRMTRVYDLQGLQVVEKNSGLPNNRILLVLLTLLFIFLLSI